MQAVKTAATIATAEEKKEEKDVVVPRCGRHLWRSCASAAGPGPAASHSVVSAAAQPYLRLW
jgi:hypothetical protein